VCNLVKIIKKIQKRRIKKKDVEKVEIIDRERFRKGFASDLSIF